MQLSSQRVQSEQSVLRWQSEKRAHGPPSSQVPSMALSQLSSHPGAAPSGMGVGGGGIAVSGGEYSGTDIGSSHNTMEKASEVARGAII